VSKKGLFPSHSASVAKFLKGSFFPPRSRRFRTQADERRYHVSIQARSENDVVPSQILKRVADSSGAKYSVHNEPAQKYQAPAPVVRSLLRSYQNMTLKVKRQTSSYVPIGRPVIQHSKPAAPPTPVGTSYQSKRDELGDIRKAQTAPSAASVPAPKTMTPPPDFGAPPVRSFFPDLFRPNLRRNTVDASGKTSTTYRAFSSSCCTQQTCSIRRPSRPCRSYPPSPC
jgi:hypothetical protein